MKTFRVWVGVCVAMLAATSASALTTVYDNANPSGEMDLYEIYNAIYGTSFTASSGAGGMDALQVTENGVFSLAASAASVYYVARYAAHDQRFGYYTNPGSPTGDYTVSGGGTSGDFNHLFDIFTNGVLILDNSGPSGTINSSPFGFYLNSPAGGADIWFSETGLNWGVQDHFVMYNAVDSNGNIIANRFLIAWEDLALGDADYNDLVLEITFNPIPEPSTMVLILMGIGGVAMRRRFSA